ncbi:MAG: septum formation initiator family protein [Candidatus Marinimicrobia bacterium]|jgi:cell division protein FtsB|nr:septum formation initiator family protein [Candidatus Neomarinimicrobiota bacterium]MBT3675465.1 septum formation initiator family protein [Candidatus Neomarinimicrobiota bacterium]MBT3762577.1 septum formation initiator family protein [Candidatus Neomarinimicrobiota bacterium]MBT4067777.1 septum formation initiator family protein [Candidatus Neomarinimicrobiota bacterium]MBT4271624.1 septum formation initiator family protein [Candidatus Neomarinimicrobiota bacterium]
MSPKSKSNRIKRNRSSGTSSVDVQKRVIRAILLIGAVALLIIFFFGDHGLYQLYNLKKERAETQEKINALREERITLEGEKTKLQTDYKYIEELAREKYRMAKKGEKVFKVIEKKREN